MILSVEQMLNLIQDAVYEQMPDGFGKNAATRRLAKFRAAVDRLIGDIVVTIPKPRMSDEGSEILKNFPKGSGEQEKPKRKGKTATVSRK